MNIPNLDPPVGIFANHCRMLFKCEFVSLNPRIESRKYAMDNSFTPGSNEEANHVKILQWLASVLCWERLIYYNFAHFATLIYWNDAFYWLENEDRQLTLYKFHTDDHDHPIITTLEISNGLHQGRNFLQSFVGGSYDLMLEQIDIPGILHMQGILFESRGCLLLVCKDDIDSREFNIYEMMKACSMWTVSKRGREKSAHPHMVFTNDDLLTEMLIRLPVLCIHLFTTVSKRLLQILTSPDFTDRRRKIPNLDPRAGEFFESCGCLLLICRDDIGSTKFTIYEMMKGSFVWSVRCLVNIEQSMNPLLEGWSNRTSVSSICLGEGETDAFVVLNLSGKTLLEGQQSRSIAAIWLERVVTPLIDPGIKSFAAASAVLKPKRLKVDKIRTLELFLDFTVCEGSSTLEDCVPVRFID
uniref:F-box domain-containing protein n=1 Tax=Tanacetum cinerariifolium TaxID=118510 RepID=A0A6L2JKN1_TANCI|nr:hypothetical protein [Tanacetum cinerariifolium]